MNGNIIKSAATLIGGLAGYGLSKIIEKVDRIPAMMFGAFLGGVIGDTINEVKKRKEISLPKRSRQNDE